MRVLMVSRGVLPIGRRCGGAELVAFELARHLALQGHQVTMVADVHEQTADVELPALSVHWLTSGSRCATLALHIPFIFPRWLAQHLVGNVRAARCAIRILRDNTSSFDVVHSHGALATVIIGRAIRRSALAIPVVYTEHDSTPWTCAPRGLAEGWVRRAIYRAVNMRACRCASVVITSHQALATELAMRSGLDATKFVVAPNGVDSGRFAPAVGRFCLFVGTLIERKAPDLLLRALAQVKLDLSLVLVGGGPMRDDLQRLAQRLRIADRVAFAGPQPQTVVRQLYQQAGFVVLPSVSEGAPLVLIEALSVGKPVVATNLRGISSIVVDGENGLLVPPNDVLALSKALAQLASDEQLYMRLSANAAASVRDRFSWEVIASQLQDIYAEQSSFALTAPPGPIPGRIADKPVRLRPTSAAESGGRTGGPRKEERVHA